MLAEISQSEAVAIVMSGVIGLATFGGIIFRMMNTFKDSIIKEVRGGLSAPAQAVAVQQPLQVQEAERFASAGAFSRHVQADNVAHKELREETLKLERELGHKLHVLKTEMIAAGEARELRLAKVINEGREADRKRTDKLMRAVAAIQGKLQVPVEGGGDDE